MVELLGGLRIVLGDRVITRFRTQKAASLFAFLVCHPERAHSRDSLIDLLWPEVDLDSGRVSLRTALADIRRDLGDHAAALLTSDRFTVGLSASAFTSDVADFRETVRRAQALDSDAIPLLKQAADICQDEMLPGFYDEWVTREREQLAEERVASLRKLVLLLEEADHLDDAIHYARQAIVADRYDENTHCLVMRLYAAVGNPTAAIRQYEELERLLKEELDTAPGERAQALAASIRVSHRPTVSAVSVSDRAENAPVYPLTEAVVTNTPNSPSRAVDISCLPARSRPLFHHGFLAGLVAVALPALLFVALAPRSVSTDQPKHESAKAPVTRDGPHKDDSAGRRVRIGSEPSGGKRHYPPPKQQKVPPESPPAPKQPTPDRAYAILEIGTLGGDTSEAIAINDPGVVVGNSPDATGKVKAFTWRFDAPTPISKDPRQQGRVFAISSDNHSVGATGDHAVHWDTRIPLEVFPPDVQSCATGVNAQGTICGYIHPSERPHQAVVRYKNKIVALRGGDIGQALAIHDDGRVTGWCGSPEGTKTAMLWEPGPPEAPYSAMPQRLEGLGGKHSEGRAFSANGIVVGAASDSSGQLKPCKWPGSKAQELPLPPGFVSGVARGMTEDGTVIGEGARSDGKSYALLWTPDGAVHTLVSLLCDGAGWELHQAVGINEDGWIVGTGLHHGKRRGFVLFPLRPGRFALNPPVISSTLDRRVIGAIRLEEPVAEDTVIELSTDRDPSDPRPAEPLWRRLTIKKGETTAVFPASINGQDGETPVMFFAKINGKTLTTRLTLLPG